MNSYSSIRVPSLLLLAAASLHCGDSKVAGADEEFTDTKSVSLSGPVIIGSGIAGARAAFELKKLGVTNITIISPEVAPGANAPDTGLTTTVPLPNGGMMDLGATLFPESYEVLEPAKELGLELVPFSTTLAIVRNGKPVVIDQVNGLSLFNLFTQEELTPTAAMGVQAEVTRLFTEGFNHRDGRLYANETRTLGEYLTKLAGPVPAQYLSVIPQILGGQDPKTASAGFQQTLYTMTSPKIFTSPQMQTLPLKMIAASGAKVEFAKVDRVHEEDSGTVIEGTRTSGEHVRWISSAPVVVATPVAVTSKVLTDASPEEKDLIERPMRSVSALIIQLTPGWTRPAELKDTAYGGVPDVEIGKGNVKGWALDFRSPAGTEKTVGLTLVRPAEDQAAVNAAIHEADKYLPGLESHVKQAIPGTNPTHAPSLTPAFYKSVDTYWKWIEKKSSRHVILAGQGSNQYGMDGASFSAKLASELVKKKMSK